MSGYCECGCGGNVPISTYTRNSEDRRKGNPIRFINGHNQRNKSLTILHKVRIGKSQKVSYLLNIVLFKKIN